MRSVRELARDDGVRRSAWERPELSAIWQSLDWVIDDLVHEQVRENTDAPRQQSMRTSPELSDEQMRDVAEDKKRRQAERGNLGLGHDVAAGLIDPTGDQARRAAKDRLPPRGRPLPGGDRVGAGWTDRERQQPVGDTGHYEPRHTDAIVAAELQRALDEPDPLSGIAQLTARWGAAFVLSPDGVTRTKALGRERIARKLSDALPGGETPLRAAVWEFMRPMLSPNLAQLNRDAFVLDEALESTVRLEQHRSDSDLAELDLGEENARAA